LTSIPTIRRWSECGDRGIARNQRNNLMQACCNTPVPRIPGGSITTAGEGICYNGPRHLTISLTQEDGIIRAHRRLICQGCMPSTTQPFSFLCPTNRGRAVSMKADTFCCAGYSENCTIDYSRHVLSEHCSFCGSANDEAPASPGVSAG
jgi:hypothetical protein